MRLKLSKEEAQEDEAAKKGQKEGATVMFFELARRSFGHDYGKMTRACCSPSRSCISKAIYDRDIAYRAATVSVASRPAIRYIRDIFTANVIALVSQRVLFYHVPVTLLSRECLYSDIWSWILSLLLLFTLGTRQ